MGVLWPGELAKVETEVAIGAASLRPSPAPDACVPAAEARQLPFAARLTRVRAVVALRPFRKIMRPGRLK